MSQAPNKIYGWLNPLLGLLAVFNIALTLYSGTQFYAYLPTSDTWIYVDFLVQAAQGQLDIAALFEKHNGVHVIALPKLVYFLDVWLTQGRGALTVVASLLAQLVSALLFFSVIQKIESLQKNEKIFLGFASAIFLLSACQVESFLNPANLQWSLLVFSATFTAWCVFHYSKTKFVGWIAGIMLGVLLVGLTSASPFLMLIPLAVIFIPGIPLKKITLAGLALVLIGGVVLDPALLKSLLDFMVAFMVPPVERLRSPPVTLLTGVLLALALWKVLGIKREEELRESVFFKLLLWFSLLLMVATGVTRSYSPFAFTFRFVNVGLLFSLTLFIYLYLQTKKQPKLSSALVAVALAYISLLSYVNYKEVSAFGFGRNHVRLNQVAYALDIQDSSVVSALPGTVWEKPDYDFVQANKYKLKERSIGIYSDATYRQVGTPISTLLENSKLDNCDVEILKMRRLLPGQAAYKLTGTARSSAGHRLSRVYFADHDGTIRGFAIPILSSRSLWESFQQGRQWSGFVNLDGAGEKQALQAYAYGNGVICKPQGIELPAFQPFIKKEKSPRN